jgi:two-component system sensor histidine kinase UhpB
VPLSWRVVGTNAVILIAACLLTVLILSPRKYASIVPAELALLAIALVALGLLNFALLRRMIAPLERLTKMSRQVQSSRSGERFSVDGTRSETAELATAFNDMLDRLERGRQESTRRVLDAQEAERLRVAQELHDEVGQTLTAVLLQLAQAARRASDPVREQLNQAQEATRASLDDVRRIARDLRPEALDDLGLVSALRALSERIARPAGLHVDRHLSVETPHIARTAELVVYRVAQEALTNVVRHAGATRVELWLEDWDGCVRLRVLDDGCGLEPSTLEGTGLQGMRERAELVGGSLVLRNRATRGLEVVLDIPIQDPAR